MESIARVLKDHPFLSGLDPLYQNILISSAKDVSFRRGEILFQQGSEANVFYIIRTGKVLLEMSTPEYGRIPIQTLGGGDVLGWSWLFAPFRWHFDGRALEPTRAIRVDGHYLRSRCFDDEKLAYEIVKRFAQLIMDRLQASDHRLASALAPKQPSVS